MLLKTFICLFIHSLTHTLTVCVPVWPVEGAKNSETGVVGGPECLPKWCWEPNQHPLYEQ